ncbi:MAG: hypothetical protein KTR15_01635 [Phycisphaeraceae bacterium]|nr:hypothetical protein [Phycisphaeraceae bacterium]
MTSEQVRLIMMRVMLLAVITGSLIGCETPRVEQRIEAPYVERQVWAIAPLRNESGSRYADALQMADQLTRAFEQVVGIDALPLNRVLEAMDALRMTRIESREDAIRLREALGVDALVVGNITHYDAYDPPKIGLALDLYAWPTEAGGSGLDIRGLSWAPTSDKAGIRRRTLYRPDQPVTTVSGYFDASGTGTKQLIDEYAYGRGSTPNKLHERRLYTINMNLFQEFAGHEMGSQLIWAEWKRLARGTRVGGRHAATDENQSP